MPRRLQRMREVMGLEADAGELRPHTAKDRGDVVSEVPDELVGDRSLDDEVAAEPHRGHEHRKHRGIRSRTHERRRRLRQ
ncbi:hypothetical protein [Agromyces marinus]|uniref:hypothetical protein n=1 Tax=Agromyces marinus TaxID=1389020 RepID=UPI00257441E3|nr:hypothetical protein [Agromyces marinus]